MMGTEAYIVDATRTPLGRRNGGLAAAHPADLAAHVLVEALSCRRRCGAVDDVIMGCVDQAGAQARAVPCGTEASFCVGCDPFPRGQRSPACRCTASNVPCGSNR
jgi:acetyl-CoA acetyltransferase